VNIEIVSMVQTPEPDRYSPTLFQRPPITGCMKIFVRPIDGNEIEIFNSHGESTILDIKRLYSEASGVQYLIFV
jgi:hypothetical protein